MQIVQHVALAIERCFGRVQILGLVARPQRAAAEADHFARLRCGWGTSAVRGNGRRIRCPPAASSPIRIVPVARARSAIRTAGQAAGRKDPRARVRTRRSAPALRCGRPDTGAPARPLEPFKLSWNTRAAISCISSSAPRSLASGSEYSRFGIGDAVAFRHQLERLKEADALDLHDELEHVAADVAAEAFVKLMAWRGRRTTAFFRCGTDTGRCSAASRRLSSGARIRR